MKSDKSREAIFDLIETLDDGQVVQLFQHKAGTSTTTTTIVIGSDDDAVKVIADRLKQPAPYERKLLLAEHFDFVRDGLRKINKVIMKVVWNRSNIGRYAVSASLLDRVIELDNHYSNERDGGIAIDLADVSEEYIESLRSILDLTEYDVPNEGGGMLILYVG